MRISKSIDGCAVQREILPHHLRRHQDNTLFTDVETLSILDVIFTNDGVIGNDGSLVDNGVSNAAVFSDRNPGNTTLSLTRLQVSIRVAKKITERLTRAPAMMQPPLISESMASPRLPSSSKINLAGGSCSW